MQTEISQVCDTYFHHEYANNKITFIRAFVVKKLEAKARSVERSWVLMQTESLHICGIYFNHEYTNNKITFIRAFVVKNFYGQKREALKGHGL